MAKDENPTVYLLGAGVNRIIRSPYGDASPPLIRDFFQVASKLDYWPGAEGERLRRLTPEQLNRDTGPPNRGQRFRQKYQRIYDYVETHWHKNFDTLVSDPFDLEQLFTRLQIQAAEATSRGEVGLEQELGGTFLELTTYLGEILQVFWGGTGFDVFSTFAQTIWNEQASVITFNYDTYLEDAIALSAGQSLPSEAKYDAWHRRFDARSANPSLGVADEDLALKDLNWDRNLAYGLEFDTVQMQQFGTAPIVDGGRFYRQPGNEPYVTRQVLKLHGSLNWFTYAPLPGLPPEEADHTVVLDWRYYKDPYWGIDLPRHPNGRLLQPAIVTPVLHKDAYFGAPIYRRLFPPVWQRARKVLSECTRLVVIGYSFSASDVRTTNLLREAFDKNDLQELVVVNPNKDIAEKAKELCHFERPVIWHCDLAELMHQSPGHDQQTGKEAGTGH
jgi:hypothetical protein